MSRFFGNSLHSGFVVPDIDQAMNRMLESGVGPFFVMRNIRVPARYRGERNDVLITAAFVYSGDFQFEFIEQHDDTPSGYREFLEATPSGGLHHLAYFCESFEEAFKKAADGGVNLNLVQEFITPDGEAFEIYVEPSDSENPLLAQLMLSDAMDPIYEEMKVAASNWDGKDPIRDALAFFPPELRPSVEAR